ncbi:coenzyme PQQ synthesis protein D (PqqD) [Chitinophaga dinghuensis]|uniref:Coenzyme PQQ synthesis protein D (PqqD) n=1 Tax=Chitinophaga dinghuensis TaxID=1539050 RepID=A0A327VVY4_9BACT|nr:PqqD family protein [Chitinophaga dinghuensis]RAJ80161.1 coenzyme PQQ synthesis protein D (PqqD) [Chitinophaga dinghuensis]
MSLLEMKVRISENAIVRELGAGFVILNLKTERFYELNEVGKRFWELLTNNPDCSAAFHQLQSEYEVAPETLQNDLNILIDHLKKAELIDCN